MTEEDAYRAEYELMSIPQRWVQERKLAERLHELNKNCEGRRSRAYALTLMQLRLLREANGARYSEDAAPNLEPTMKTSMFDLLKAKGKLP